jgi:hypothetical protein
MWYIIDKRFDIVVGSYPTRAEARKCKNQHTFFYGKNYRLETF